MVVLFDINNQPKNIYYNDYHNKEEFWKKYIELKMKYNEKKECKIEKIIEQVNNLLKK
tara:strand:+ start:10 stop:183 length:174 start_codon:yes stop_codon:yes gene_type:complete